MKRYYLLILYFFLQCTLLLPRVVYAQRNPDDDKFGSTPVVIPPSPEVAELARISQLETQLFTGASNVTIPISELNVGSVKVPIAIAYSNNGVKANDLPGRVGLGWNLTAGGSVSRFVHDEPDDDSTPLSPVQFGSYNQNLINYLFYATQYGYDTEHDLYAISAPGLSGRFFIDETGVPRFINHSNLEVLVEAFGFTIINAEGLRYYFGTNGIIEKTREIVLTGNEPAHKIQTTAWFLTRIDDPDGNYIEFNYSPIYFKTIQGAYQSVTLQLPGSTDPCGVCNAVNSSVKFNKLDYDSYYLTSIHTSANVSASFNYQLRPDLSGDNRLSSITINSGNEDLKKFTFEYLDIPNVGNQLNRKFFLSRIYQKTTDATNQQILLNEFDYIEPSSITDQRSLAQDYFGYSNGAVNSNFWPVFPGAQNFENGEFGANRFPNFDYALTGILQRVKFATGGYQEYTYEPHTLYDSVYSNNVNTVYTPLIVGGPGLEYSDPNLYEQEFTPQQNQKITVQAYVNANPGGPVEGDPNYWAPDGNFRIARIEMKDLTTNTSVFSRQFFTYGNHQIDVYATAGHNYKVLITVSGSTNQAFLTAQYDPVIQTGPASPPINKKVPGVRVAAIHSYDPTTGQTNHKFYKYASVAQPNRSSGKGYAGRPSVERDLGGYCQNAGGSDGSSGYGETLYYCSSVTVNSSNPAPPLAYNGSNVAYEYVVESSTSDFSQGCTEHHFFTATDGSMLAVLNKIIPSFSYENPGFAGLEDTTATYRMQNGSLVKSKTIERVYNKDTRVHYTQENYMVRKRWKVPSDNAFSIEKRVSGCDISLYLYESGWIKLDTVITKIFDSNGQNPLIEKQCYEYADINHTLPTNIRLIDSKQRIIATALKYPSDFIDAVYSRMVSKHILSPVIEQQISKNNVLTSRKVTQYHDWFSNQSVFKPIYLKTSTNTTTLDTRVEFHNYDPSGNVTEQSLSYGPSTAYIWGYNGQYPVAEIRNATYAQVLAVLGQVKIDQLAGSSPGDDASVRSLLAPLRAALPGSLVTTYTYKPLVGMTSVTDAKGETTYYEYDSFQRLQTIRDHNKNVLKQYDYHYQNQ